jgi:3-(methylthio)propionyl---CoA ligase
LHGGHAGTNAKPAFADFNLIAHAERHHGSGEIVSRRVEGDIHRSNWAEVARRSRQVAHALDNLQLAAGDRVATLAWNGYRHLELYFGVSGTGRVLHTLNPRLHPEQLAWIINHAEDQALCFDMTVSCPWCRPWRPSARGQALGGPVRCRQAARRQRHAGLVSYEAWMGGPDRVRLARVRRKQRLQHVLHQRHHRQPQGRAVLAPLHHPACLQRRAARLAGLSARDSVLPVVPMFHVNAWGIPYSAAATGAASWCSRGRRWTANRSTS